MEGHSAHSTAPLRSRSSQTHTPSPSHSASASVGSSVHKRKLASEEHPATFPFYANDDVESISARGAETETEDESEEVVDEEEDNDSMRTFTTARLENNNVSGRSTKLKTESSTVKVDSSSVLEVGKEERGPTAAMQAAAGAGGGSVAGIVVKEDMKSIFTENLQTSGAYSAREESLKREEEAGRLKFVCFANDGIDEHMIWLIGLKNIFARQLPNMPKEYIVRLVMDRSHKSVMVIRHNVVVGGITYRPYVSQKFGEIAFCAITADEQVKGYGTRLMNHLKQHARDVDGLTHFLTYADNNAVGYFNKQGFTKEIHLDKEIWQGYIKDYDGGILMECKIDPKLPYTDLSTMIRRQRQNFLFTSKDENSQLKAIDFGLSDFVKPDERLNDIVGSAYYVAPEVLHRSYSTEADVWSIGVIAYILLCGSRPFWARTESGIFRAVLKADPSFDEAPWPSLSSEAKDFVRRLLNKDPRKRMTAAQALSHPWIRNDNDIKVPLDILIFKLMKTYMRSSSLRKAALRALSKTLTVDELFYLKEQFALLEPNKSGSINLENIRMALMKSATDVMKESRILDFIGSLNALQYRRMDFEEFCAAALSVHQLEALDRWEQHARCAYELFDKDGNRAIVIEELASELGLSPSVPVHAVLHDWIRHTDGKLSFLGFVKLLHGVSSRTLAKVQ